MGKWILYSNTCSDYGKNSTLNLRQTLISVRVAQLSRRSIAWAPSLSSDWVSTFQPHINWIFGDRSKNEHKARSIRSAGSEIVPGLVRFPNFGNQNRYKNDFYSEEYRVRQHNSLLEIEKRAALGSTSQCSPVLPYIPFPVGHSLAEISRFHHGQNESILNSFELGLTQP